ncbi:sensor histidine kinase [Clostridium paraputrificum]|uniref:sensor histidine kinase n=1 Tax=Clostridium paraputrificum TaxID=29363 RepID=UPI003D336C6C
MDSLLQVTLVIIILLLQVFSLYIVFDFMSKFERTLYHKKSDYILSYFIFLLVLILTGVVFGNGFINLIVSLIGTVIIGHCLYNDQKIFIVYYSIFIVILSASQIIVSSIFQGIVTLGNITFNNLDLAVITNSIVIQFANLSGSKLFIHWYKNKRINRLSKAQFFNFLLLPMVSIFYIVTLMMYFQTNISFGDSLVLLVNIVSIIALNIFITDIFQSISKNNEMKSELLLYEQQSNMQYEYYNSLEEKYKSSRKIIHDIKNHLHTIENLYNLKEEEKANYYSKDLYKMFDGLEQRYYTDNKVLNIIINDKCEVAKKFGIRLDCKIGDVNLGFIKDIDLTTVFSNLLDNAIDEVKGLVEEKEIFLKVDKFNEFLVINISNSLRSKPIRTNDKFKSTKENHKGLGLQNVKMAIEKYEGNLRIDFNEKEFKVNIVIPID